MDSKDKRIADQVHEIAHLKKILPQREAQIETLKKILSSYEDNASGVDAVRTSLITEKELTVQLNLQLETLKRHAESLKEENESLKAMNYKLQNPSKYAD
jgi:predicted RNase H-like nuclease (RuvC/YqgF family)